MKAVSKIVFLDRNNEKFFGEGPARLLHGIEEKGSLRSAAMSMNMAYTKALKLMKHAEAALGFPLTTRTAGGRDGGGSSLTPEGRHWLARYEAYRDACIESNHSLFRQHFPETGCVIMASGLGVRFGGNKLMAEFGNAPLIQRALQATEGLFQRRVVVTRHQDVAELCREQNINVILHELPHRNDTIRLGLEALNDVDCCMFLPGDQPLLRRETVARLIQHWEENRNCFVRPVCNGTPGAPVLFPSCSFPELLSLPEGKGGSLILQKHPDQIRMLHIDDPFELMDADTPDALELLRLHLAGTDHD